MILRPTTKFRFAEVPNFDILPPSSTFAPAGNAARYAAWSAPLDASSEWVRATSFPHPQFDPDAFFLHDMGVLTLSRPVSMGTYGALPQLGLIDDLYRADRNATYTPRRLRLGGVEQIHRDRRRQPA